MSLPAPRPAPKLIARLVDLAPGRHAIEAARLHRLIMHHGAPVLASSVSGGMTTPLHVQRDGDLDFIPAGLTARWTDDGPSRVLALSLCPSAFSEAAGHLGRASRRLLLTPRLSFRDDRLAGLARLAPREDDADAAGTGFGDALARTIAVRILHLLQQDAPLRDRVRPLEGWRLRAALLFIENHLDEALTLDRVARETGLKRSQFAAAFRLATGQSPRQYVIRRRVEAATRLLAAGGASISEVAFQTGFSHQSHLSRAIRKFTGRTPGELARRAGPAAPGQADAPSARSTISAPNAEDNTPQVTEPAPSRSTLSVDRVLLRPILRDLCPTSFSGGA